MAARRTFSLITSGRGRDADPDLPLAAAAFERRGLDVEIVAWDDPNVSWDRYDLSIIRSCWDYSWRREEFLDWAVGVPRLCNPAEILEWSTDKRYLLDLDNASCPIVPTTWNPRTIDELPAGTEWVVKPTISAGSRDTARWSEAESALEHVNKLVADGRNAMAQPYLTAVDTEGETALLFLGGQFSHAVRKGPLLRRGEGVSQQRDSRGDLVARNATPGQLAVARRALGLATERHSNSTPLLYARVDVVTDDAGRCVVLELELAEPSLFLPQCPAAAERLVDSAVHRADHLPGH